MHKNANIKQLALVKVENVCNIHFLLPQPGNILAKYLIIHDRKKMNRKGMMERHQNQV